ncbi:lysylphosphatidylglycerol synthase transmembrane domain-containing protein [Holzapfeliella sp. He02]|uniref:Phosphatidylglycerol lysyltransferase n=1 Tax=Holzapfeliella saturejae TaxID=3082953 RepID=A0ABU8SEM2_9LACO
MTRQNKLWFVGMLLFGSFIFWLEAKDVPFSHLVNATKNFNWFYLAIAFLCMIVAYYFESLILKVLLIGREKSNYSMWQFYRIPLVQALFNAITPFSSGGQPAQLYALSTMGVEVGRASSLLMTKFIIYQLAVLVNFILTMIFGFQLVAQHFGGLAFLILFGFVIHVFAIVFLLLVMFQYRFTKAMMHTFLNIGVYLIDKFYDFIGFLVRSKTEKLSSLKTKLQDKKVKWEEAVDEKIDTFYNEGQHLKNEKKKVMWAVLYTMLQLIVFYLIPYFVLLALGVQANVMTVIFMHIMIVMITSIFPLPGGAGGAEYSFKMLFSTFGLAQPQLVLALFLWRFITYYLGMFLGACAFLYKKKS